MTEICAALVVLTNLSGTVSVDLDGGRVVSYVSHGEEQLWMPEPPQSAPGWRHGGIPLCWPWFGVNGKGELHDMRHITISEVPESEVSEDHSQDHRGLPRMPF